MTSSSHNHESGIKIGLGKIQFDEKDIAFAEGEIYVDRSSENEEQRVCIQLLDKLPNLGTTSVKNPFSTLHLNDPIRIGNIPLKHFQVFLLSATISDDRIDALISPKDDRLNEILRPEF